MRRKRLPDSASAAELLSIWDDIGPKAQLNLTNNCYSYACASLEAIADMEWRAHAEATPQPGDCSGIPKNILLLLYNRSLPFWMRLSQRDGLRLLQVGKDDMLPDLPGGERLVALTYNPKYSDYHWLRRERDGLWTHKPDSGRPPTRYDMQRQLISDPRHADLYYEYPAFAFFAVPEEGIDVRMPKEWLKFFNSLDDATYGNYEALRGRLRDLAHLIRAQLPVMADYLEDKAAQGTETELKLFWQHLRTGKRLPYADGLLPLDELHAPIGIAWQAATRS